MFSDCNTVEISSNIGTRVTLMGKLNFIKDPLSNKRLPILECWRHGDYIIYWFEEGRFSYDITSLLFEESKETIFVLECQAIISANNVLRDIKCFEIYKQYKDEDTLSF